MAKKTTTKIWKKNEVVTHIALNQSLNDVGSVGGLQPYNDNRVQDITMSLPIGSKSTPFGDVFCKGLNVYTQAEVLALVTAGKLTSSDKMLFIDPTTSGLYIFNGSQIQQIGGSNMDYLFGDGSDGDVTLVANANYDVPKQFTNFTLNSGVTLSVTNNANPLIIRCTGTCTINGTINLDGKGFAANGSGANGINNSIYGAGGGDGYFYNYMGSSTDTHGTGGGSTCYPANESAIANILFQQLLSLDFKISCGGSGGNGSSSPNGLGGNGGGALIIIAKSFKGTGTITAKGNNGNGQSNAYYGGGGGGGQVGVITSDNSFTGSITVTGGTGAAYNNNFKAKNGGDGAYAILKI